MVRKIHVAVKYRNLQLANAKHYQTVHEQRLKWLNLWEDTMYFFVHLVGSCSFIFFYRDLFFGINKCLWYMHYLKRKNSYFKKILRRIPDVCRQKNPEFPVFQDTLFFVTVHIIMCVHWGEDNSHWPLIYPLLQSTVAINELSILLEVLRPDGCKSYSCIMRRAS